MGEGADADDEESNADPEAAEAAVEADGFGKTVMKTADVDEDSDVDFTDAADATDRGFIPSIQPSPAFQPRGSTDMTDIMSPLCMPMSTTDEDDGFALPSASVPLDVGSGPSSMLKNLLGSAAFMEGR